MSWREKLRDLPFDVLVQLLVMAIAALLVKAWPVTKIWLRNTAHVCHQAGSKIYYSIKRILSPLRGISFHTGAIRDITHFAGQVFGGVARVAGFWILLLVMLYQTYKIAGLIGDVFSANASAKTAASERTDTCNCPTPSSPIYTRATIEPEWRQRGVSSRNCTQHFGVRSQYPAQSVLYTRERTPVFDCSHVRKGRRSKRVIQPCTIDIPAYSTGRYNGSGYSIDDEPQ
jgi:hypothetical protein